MGACGSSTQPDQPDKKPTTDQKVQEQDENGSDFLYEFETDSDEVHILLPFDF